MNFENYIVNFTADKSHYGIKENKNKLKIYLKIY